MPVSHSARAFQDGAEGHQAFPSHAYRSCASSRLHSERPSLTDLHRSCPESHAESLSCSPGKGPSPSCGPISLQTL